jgi:hypothetical protein
MTFIEVLLSYSKLLVVFFVIGVALFYLLFRVMSGGMFFYYSRSTDFIGMDHGLLHASAMSKKFKPVFKDVRALPLNSTLLVEGVLAGNKKFKRMETGTLRHEIFLE